MKHYWHSSSCGRIETRIPEDAIRDCSGQGRADEAVEYWSGKIARPDKATPETLAACLKEFGAWDAEELADDAQNWRRWLWTACCDLAEADEMDEAEGGAR
jgi:hypothetical protein